MINPPDPRNLYLPPDARLPARRILILSVSLFGGALLFLVLPMTLAAPKENTWRPVGVLTLGLFISLLPLLKAFISWRNQRWTRRLLQVPPPNVLGVWLPELTPLSAHSRLALAQAAPMPKGWAISHDGRHAYVVKHYFGLWHRLARRSR